jgi:cyclohexadienyl dehydratase
VTLGEVTGGVNHRISHEPRGALPPEPRSRLMGAGAQTPREATLSPTRRSPTKGGRAPVRKPPSTVAMLGGVLGVRLGVMLGLLAGAIAGCTHSVTGLARAETPDELRVGTSGDYAPFSQEVPGPGEAAGFRQRGFDPDLARAYAKDRNLSLRFVPFRWPELVADLEAGRFDVAMSGITVRPERSLAGRFSLPTASSGAVALVPEASSLFRPDDLNRVGLRIAVNAGGHLEQTARKFFPEATLVALQDNAGVIDALARGATDAAISDTREAPHWQATHPGLRMVGPFTSDRKALLVAAEQAELAHDLNVWLLARERSGRMAALRSEHLGDPVRDETPHPALSALLAAIAERLALMPWVAEAKRDAGSAVEVPEREARVINAALAQVRETEEANDIAPAQRVRAAAVRELFAAQIEAAKSIQHAVLRRPRPPGQAPPPALDTVLRPALLRIGERIAWLIVQLPPGIPDDVIRARSQSQLRGLGLAEERIDDLARGLIAVDGTL